MSLTDINRLSPLLLYGCISENAESIDKIVALHKSKSSTKTLPKAKATDGNLPYRHFFA
jgi:hypothetical protein